MRALTCVFAFCCVRLFVGLLDCLLARLLACSLTCTLCTLTCLICLCVYNGIGVRACVRTFVSCACGCVCLRAHACVCVCVCVCGWVHKCVYVCV